ncbi:hypothetical protein V7112_23695 [Bacillus sp. JJ1566]|uniref:hypothetical protein n=1 Tax=Bacillus sp. JJ1566 TaxID=3122961 RepID=UPI002FFEAEB8
MSKETINVIILVLGLILVALSRFPIMSQTIAIIIGLIGAATIILATVLMFKNKKSKK